MLSDPQIWLSLATLTALEIVLGIDNIVFIAIMVKRVDETRRNLAYRFVLGGALVMRLAWLFTLTCLMKLTAPLFTLAQRKPPRASFGWIAYQELIRLGPAVLSFRPPERRDSSEILVHGVCSGEFGFRCCAKDQSHRARILIGRDRVGLFR